MYVRKTFVVYLLLMIVSYANCQTIDTSGRHHTELIFASDTQAPMWIETLWLKPTNNRAATRSIFDNLALRNPAAVFLLGDVVNLGSSNRQWKPIDKYLDTLRSKDIKVMATMGNHEVMGRPKQGQRKFQKRFPDHVKTGFATVVDSVAVVLLNSNFGTLSEQEEQEQLDWYKGVLDGFDSDPSIKFIVSGCHHSPYTNSKIVGSSMAVRQRFVPLYLKSKKSKLFLSGHSHNFEHFKFEGKEFFVIGGGGGLHQPLRKGDGILQDLSQEYKPMFHYLSVRRHEDKLLLTSVRLKNDQSGFEDGKQFEIN